MKVLSNDIEKILVSPEQIDELTTRIAKQITEDYKDSTKKLVLVCILKGSLLFTAELMKKLDIPVEVEFMKVSSYGVHTESTGVINIHVDLMRDDLDECNFILVEDIVDSGRTFDHLIRYFIAKGAASVKTCTMLDKPSRRVVELVPDYIGVEIPDEFVVGFGLDYIEEYRNLPFVGVLKPEIYR